MHTLRKAKLDDVLEEKALIERSSRLRWFHWAIILSSLLLTFGAWYVAKTQLEIRNKNIFDREASRIVEMISERMKKYEDALWSGVASIHAQDYDIDYTKWKRFSDKLSIEERYPGINGIGVIYDIKESELESFLQDERSLRPDFKIHPPHDQSDSFPITYIEPFDVNKEAVGLDMAHEENRYEAFKLARDTMMAKITGPITLVQDAEKTPGFLFYAPFYKKAELDTVAQRREGFIGAVYAPFIIKNLMRGTLETERRHVGIKITDDDLVLYDELTSDSSSYDAQPLFSSKILVSVYGRSWMFDIQTDQSFRSIAASSRPWVILFSGLVIDSLLLGLFLFLAHSNRRALKFARSMVEEYEEQANHLKEIINSAVDGLLTIDEKGIVRSFNPACEQMFGFKAEDVIGEDIKMLISDPFFNRDEDFYVDSRRVNQMSFAGAGLEVYGQKDDGAIFPVEFSISEIVIDGEKLYSGIVRDITERKNAEEKLKENQIFQELILDTIPDFVFVKDEEFRIVQANQAFLNNYPEDKRDKVIGYTTLEEYPPEQAEAFIVNDRDAFEQGYNGAQETVSFPDGSTRTLFTKKVRFFNDGKKYILGVSRDITEMKKAEDEIIRSNEELERFAYVASHDLQEPLRMVRSFTELLKKKYADQLDETANEYIDFAFDGATRMQELISDLLEYGRLGQEAERRELVDLNKILSDVENNLKDPITQSGAEIIYEELPTIYVNPVRILRVFQNLIGNAIKYQNTSVQPIIHLSVEMQEKERLFCVKDNGIGMKQEYCQRIFEPYKRLHGKDEYSGTGMGLAICRKIIEGLGGKMWAESEPNKGSQFYFTIPADNDSSEKEESS